MTIRIGVCGGGIASLCLGHAINKKNTPTEILIFESSNAWRDEGAAFGLGSNAQDALELMSPNLRAALDTAGGTPLSESRVVMGTGDDMGRVVGTLKPSGKPALGVKRGRFWRALHQQLPENVKLLSGKRVSHIVSQDETGTNNVEVLCEDGTRYEFDAVIGCDGVNSITRETVLGPTHPALGLEYAFGYYFHQVVVSIDEARAALGGEFCSYTRQSSWLGVDGGFLLTDFNDDGDAMQIVASWADPNMDPWPYDTPVVEWPLDVLKQKLEPWGAVGQGMIDIFSRQTNLLAIAPRVHKETPIFSNGSICIAGDAAQSFLPFQGAGVGQALEDVLMLSTVVGECRTSHDIPKAFTVYDEMRRPRRQDIARSSEWAAHLLTGRDPEVGLNIDKLRSKIQNWAHNVTNYDLVAAQEEARQRMAA